MRIDAFRHFWNGNPVAYSCINEPMAAIPKGFLPDELFPVLQQQGFDGCVAAQSEQPEENNDLLVKRSSKNAFLKSVVGWTDLTGGNVRDKLGCYRHQPAIKGSCPVLQGEKDRDFMMRENLFREVAALQESNYTDHILIFTGQLPPTEKIIELFPVQKFIVDHLAKSCRKRGEIGP